jgi:hypothetical protein
MRSTAPIRHALLSALVVLTLAVPSRGQDLEPRSFSQAPVGMNFGVLTYGHAGGEVLFDQAVPITEAQGRLNNLAVAYVRTLDFFGASAKAVVALPYAWGHWHGFLDGSYADVTRSGFSDLRLQLAVNFIGAPAIRMSEMKSYRNRTVVGASLQAVVPTGQYDPEKLINLGANRWAFRPRLGMSHRTGRLSLEAIASVWLFADNPDFYGGVRLHQDPLWSLQGHAVYQFPSGVWFGLGAGLSRGGKNSSNGVYGDSYKKNTRWAGILSYPLARRYSVKLLYINGIKTRLGSDFDQLSVSLQARWGGER